MQYTASAGKRNSNGCGIKYISGVTLSGVDCYRYYLVIGRLYCQEVGEKWMLMRKRRKKNHHSVRKIFQRLLAVLLCILFAVGAFFSVKGYQMYNEAVTEKSVSERVEEIRGGETFTPYSELPQFYIDATISVEDHRFNEHFGIDLIAIGRAAWTDIKERSFVQGGSTITQQLAKNMLFTQDKKIERKIAEIFASLDLESKYTKKEIFELYVNISYFGNGYYGVGKAATGYLGKVPSELSEYECAMLAGIPNAPSAYSPDGDNQLTARRTEMVLDSMVRNEMITEEDANRIRGEK